MAKNIKLPFILIFCSACFVFVFATFSQQHSINDSLEYQSAAKNLIKNNSLYAGETNEILDYRLFSKRTAGFPFYLIFQYISPWVVGLASVFLLLLSYFFGLHLVNRLTKNRKTSRVY
jgi:Ca2+/Na+ antiporter